VPDVPRVAAPGAAVVDLTDDADDPPAPANASVANASGADASGPQDVATPSQSASGSDGAGSCDEGRGTGTGSGTGSGSGDIRTPSMPFVIDQLRRRVDSLNARLRRELRGLARAGARGPIEVIDLTD
jgi:hypothetical protein